MNPSNGQTSLDYLNQIAPQAPKKPGFGLNFPTILIGAAVAIVVVIILAVVANLAGSGGKSSWERLSLRLATTSEVAEGASANIKNTQLRSYNSNLKLYLADTTRDLADPLAAFKITPKTTSPKITAEEAGDEMKAAIEDGRLNAKFDSTYAREMGYHLTTVLSLLQEMYPSASPTHQAFLQTAYDNLKPITSSFEEFSTANE